MRRRQRGDACFCYLGRDGCPGPLPVPCRLSPYTGTSTFGAKHCGPPPDPCGDSPRVGAPTDAACSTREPIRFSHCCCTCLHPRSPHRSLGLLQRLPQWCPRTPMTPRGISRPAPTRSTLPVPFPRTLGASPSSRTARPQTRRCKPALASTASVVHRPRTLPTLQALPALNYHSARQTAAFSWEDRCPSPLIFFSSFHCLSVCFYLPPF